MNTKGYAGRVSAKWMSVKCWYTKVSGRGLNMCDVISCYRNDQHNLETDLEI